MDLDDIIKQLQTIRQEHGNVPVRGYTDGSYTHEPPTVTFIRACDCGACGEGAFIEFEVNL